jgi:serine/threonine protein kinase
MISNPADRSEFKLIDFGFAKKHNDHEIIDSCGSPGYVAPEIITCHRHGPTVDIYSAGILFYVVLAGYSPFFSHDKKEVLKKNALSQLTFGKKWEAIDPKFPRLISAMTNLVPTQRASVEELKALMSVSHTLTVPIPARKGSDNEPVAATVPILPPINPMMARPSTSQTNLAKKRLQSM